MGEILTPLSVQTDIEITREEDFARILQMEEEYIQQICEDLMRVKPDLVITEKGISGNNTCDPSLCRIHLNKVHAMLSAPFGTLKKKTKTKHNPTPQPDFEHDPGFGLDFSFLANSSTLQALNLGLEVAL